MPIEIMTETVTINIENPTGRLSGQMMADVHVFVQVKNTENKPVKLEKDQITFAIKNTTGRILVAAQPDSVNGSWDNITLEGNGSKILNLEFLFSQQIIDKLRNGIGSEILEIASHSVELPGDKDHITLIE